jgi:hypothetical protein
MTHNVGHITQGWRLYSVASNTYKSPALGAVELRLVKPNLRKCRCYMPLLDTINYFSNVDNFIIDYGTLIKKCVYLHKQ